MILLWPQRWYPDPLFIIKHLECPDRLCAQKSCRGPNVSCFTCGSFPAIHLRGSFSEIITAIIYNSCWGFCSAILYNAVHGSHCYLLTLFFFLSWRKGILVAATEAAKPHCAMCFLSCVSLNNCRAKYMLFRSSERSFQHRELHDTNSLPNSCSKESHMFCELKVVLSHSLILSLYFLLALVPTW